MMDTDEVRRRPPWPLLLRYSAGVRLRVAGGGVLTFLGTAVSLTLPLLVQMMLTAVAHHRPILPVLLLLVVAIVVSALISALGYYLLEYAGEAVVLAVRTRLIGHILRLRVDVVDKIPPGELMSRVIVDTTVLRQVTTQGLASATAALIGLVGALVLMVFLDWLLLVVTLSTVALMTVTIRWSTRRIGTATGDVQIAVAAVAALLDRCLGALRTVKAAGAEPAEIEKLAGSVRGAWRRGLRLAGWQAASGTTAILTLQVAFLTVLGVGGGRVAAGRMSVGDLIAFLLFMLYLGHPITTLASAYGQYQAGAAAATRLEHVFGLAVEAPGGDPPAVQPLPPVPPNGHRGTGGRRGVSVDFDDVVFAYASDAPRVHRGVTFSVPPGGTTAIVGPSGTGKSTVFALIERFYEVSGGRVLVDGVDVRDWPLNELRATIGYVEQDAPALAGTLRENLTLGLGRVSDAQLHGVLEKVGLGQFVVALPGGLDGLIAHRGITVSGGERQRIAIARALLRAPRLLLLDEATSQLDAANERALRDSVRRISATTTVIVVAHRLSTVVDARRIVVLEDGRVRACGTHTELVETDPVYRDLAATQLLATPPPRC